MPLYDYECQTCGIFSEFQSVEHFGDDCACPDCGQAAPRRLLSVPHFSTASRSGMKAHAINEKNAHMPETTARSGKHPPGCSCCGTKRQAKSDNAAKTFPGTRPWMISH